MLLLILQFVIVWLIWFCFIPDGSVLLCLDRVTASLAQFDPVTASLAVSAASSLFNIGRQFFQPDLPFNSNDINRIIDLQMRRALSEVAGGTRRRLIGAGQEGSGTINTAINDAQSRVREMFEEQRQKALNLYRQAKFQRDQAAFDRLTSTLGEITNLGFSGFMAAGGLGKRPQFENMFNPSSLPKVGGVDLFLQQPQAIGVSPGAIAPSPINFNIPTTLPFSQ